MECGGAPGGRGSATEDMGGSPWGAPTGMPTGNSVEAWCRSTLMASSRFDLPPAIGLAKVSQLTLKSVDSSSLHLTLTQIL